MPDHAAGDGQALLAELARLLRERAGPPPLLLDPQQSWTLLGLSKATFYRLVSGGDLPGQVDVPGSGPRWRRADLERWAEKLKARRRKAKPADAPAG